MIQELHGTVTFVDGYTVDYVAPATDEIEDGCRVYEARIPLHFDEDGRALFMGKATIDVLPAKSSVRFTIATENEVKGY